MPDNFRYKNGFGSTSAYQVSSRPFLTSSLNVPSLGQSPMEISFDKVSKFVIITNTLPGSATNVPLRFGFSVNGITGSVNNNYAVLNNAESFEADFRVTSLYLLSDTTVECSASVVAGLTTIDAGDFTTNWSGSSGVG